MEGLESGASPVRRKGRLKRLVSNRSLNIMPAQRWVERLNIDLYDYEGGCGAGGSHDFFQARSIVPVMALEKPLKLQLYIETLT